MKRLTQVMFFDVVQTCTHQHLWQGQIVMGQSFYCSCLTKKIAYWKIIIFPCHVIFIMSWLLILMLSSIHLWGQASLQIMCCKILYVIQNLHCTLWKCLDEYQSSLDGIFHFKVCGMFCGQNGSTYKWCYLGSSAFILFM